MLVYHCTRTIAYSLRAILWKSRVAGYSRLCFVVILLSADVQVLGSHVRVTWCDSTRTNMQLTIGGKRPSSRRHWSTCGVVLKSQLTSRVLCDDILVVNKCTQWWMADPAPSLTHSSPLHSWLTHSSIRDRPRSTITWRGLPWISLREWSNAWRHVRLVTIDHSNPFGLSLFPLKYLSLRTTADCSLASST